MQTRTEVHFSTADAIRVDVLADSGRGCRWLRLGPVGEAGALFGGAAAFTALRDAIDAHLIGSGALAEAA